MSRPPIEVKVNSPQDLFNFGGIMANLTTIEMALMPYLDDYTICEMERLNWEIARATHKIVEERYPDKIDLIPAPPEIHCHCGFHDMEDELENGNIPDDLSGL